MKCRIIKRPTEKAMAPHSSTLAWKIPWTEEPGRLQSMGSLRVDMTQWLHFHFSLSCIGEGNGNPLQCSCLENPRDGGAWWGAVYGVAQNQTWLKQLSSSSSSSSKEAQVFLKTWQLTMCPCRSIEKLTVNKNEIVWLVSHRCKNKIKHFLKIFSRNQLWVK